MGQRLNIEITNDNGVLANCYYHWAGYSVNSLEITKIIIQHMEKNKIENSIQGAIELLKITGASFNEESWNKAKSEGFVSGDYQGCKGRNEGLISATKDEIEGTRHWEEGRIEINIENKTFNFKCAWEKEYNEDEEIWERISDLFYKIEGMESAYKIDFDKIDLLISGIKEAEKNYSGRFQFGYHCFDSIY